MTKPSRIASALLVPALALLIISLSIAVPILLRPFYYLHIDGLSLPQRTGWSREVIQFAYDDMLDFCLWGGEFRTGALGWSESGKSHFVDVQALFRLDLALLALSAAAVTGLLVWSRVKRVGFHPLLGRGPAFWAGASVAGLFTAIGALAALDFDRAFVVFHSLFFPGKHNWIFDPELDQIILILPEVFFRNCAILIVALLLLFCVGLMAADLLSNRAACSRSPVKIT